MRSAARRHRCWHVLTFIAVLAIGAQALAQTDPLPSWNDIPKQAIVDFCTGDHRPVESNIRAARGTDRHLRPGWHPVGRAPDVFAGDTVWNGAGGGQGEAGARQRRTLQDRAVRQPRGDGEAR